MIQVAVEVETLVFLLVGRIIVQQAIALENVSIVNVKDVCLEAKFPLYTSPLTKFHQKYAV